DHTAEFLTLVLSSYVESITATPSTPSLARQLVEECGIRERNKIPLTCNHLIPREVLQKMLKRKLHTVDHLKDVAWVYCACHNQIHKLASNESLAWNWSTVEKLLERDGIRFFAAWMGKVRVFEVDHESRA
ncbi:hypothetical protein BJ878DRAFT_422396, partial [Calycina marina]